MKAKWWQFVYIWLFELMILEVKFVAKDPSNLGNYTYL